MGDKENWKRWRIEYLPTSLRPGEREWVFEGAKEDLDAWFLEKHVCDACREEMKGGPQVLIQYNKDGEEVERTVRDATPYSNPWHTGCGAEYTLTPYGYPTPAEVWEAFTVLEESMRSEQRCGRGGLDWLEMIQDYVRTTMGQTPIEPSFAPMVEACKAHGISRTVAYELQQDGMLETFLIGTRRYVLLESLRMLPERLAAKEAANGRR